MAFLILIFVIVGAILGVVAAFGYRRILRKAKAIERGLKMVPLLIHLPPPSSDTEASGRDVREVRREKLSQAEVLYNLIAGTAQAGFKSRFYGQRHIALEIIATGGTIHYYAAVPVALTAVVEKAVVTAYPGARVEEVADYNIFSERGKLTGTLGGELILKASASYPIATYKRLEADPMEALLNAVATLQAGEGAGVQLLLRPATRDWVKEATALVKHKRGGGKSGGGFTPLDLARAAVKAPGATAEGSTPTPSPSAPTGLEATVLEAVEEKTRYPGYEVLIRLVASSSDPGHTQVILQNMVTAFALLDAPGLNGFKYLPAADLQGLVTAFIFRFFPPSVNQNILSSAELATLFHLPDAQFTPVAGVERQLSKQVDGPAAVPATGLLMGYNFFRGVKKEIRLSPEDRRRHTYIVGQTGTGKSTLLENLAVQDMLSGGGFAFIDPHGDTAERLISMVPKTRAEDVIYFNPGDAEMPLGLNLFEFTDPSQKDFLIQEAIGMLYKLYDPGHTGIIGPRYEHWFRNAALTLMSDPAGSTFIEVPKVFTDTEYLKTKFRYLTDPTVIDFWTKEMAATSDYHKSEMLGWFVSKFGAFMTNDLMRNIIGQTKSAFNLREVMDQKKILIVNLSKGRVGELNSQLLGMMLVIKIQAAAMSRANVPQEQRNDFSLFVDEFQNFSTDSFATILSEARKYGLNLVVANQFIGQLTPEIRDAVFGNVGSAVSFRVGPEDADFLVKQFAPVFDARDLVNLPNYNAVIRLMIGGLPSQPFTLQTLPPLGMASAELGLAVKQLSAAKFGHPRAEVEAAILGRLKSGGAVPPVPAAVIPAPAAVPTPPPDLAVPSLPPPPVSPSASPSNGAQSPDHGTLKLSDIAPSPASAAPTPSADTGLASPPTPSPVPSISNTATAGAPSEPLPAIPIPPPTPSTTSDPVNPTPTSPAVEPSRSSADAISPPASSPTDQSAHQPLRTKSLPASRPRHSRPTPPSVVPPSKSASTVPLEPAPSAAPTPPVTPPPATPPATAGAEPQVFLPTRERLPDSETAPTTEATINPLAEASADPATPPAAAPEPVGASPTPAALPPPKLAPGEVFVDDDGNVTIG